MAVENIKSVNMLRTVTRLDAGESEAIILYDEQGMDLLLMDEHKGRIVKMAATELVTAFFMGA